jgi:hypothetical protein
MTFRNAGSEAQRRAAQAITPIDFENDAAEAAGHIRWLAETIGPRGSCTPQERQAAEYAAGQLTVTGMEDVQTVPFEGAVSAYTRYALICGLGAAASLAALIIPFPIIASAAALLQLAAAQAMLYESDFRPNWSRLVIPGGQSQNVIARCAASGPARQVVVLLAHLDSARTPSFNASRSGQRLYGVLFRGLFLSFLLAALLSAVLAIQPALPLAAGLIAAMLLQLCALVLFIFADRAPYSPGAYDNASGAACVLAAASRLQRQPLRSSELWICLTGCEETGAGGAAHLYSKYGKLWRNPWVINLDQFGYENIYLRSEEGLLLRRRTKDECISAASAVADRLPGINFHLRASQAFSDAAPAYQRGLRAFSFGTSPLDGEVQTHRHRQTDTPEHLSDAALRSNLCYIWNLVRELDDRERQVGDG